MAVQVMFGNNVTWLMQLQQHSFVFYCVKLVSQNAE
jgi:hypothetical protein